ncbi:MAG: Gfo/Idh/MocA family oxidoreductase [Acidobacteria bacterium]|nr:Gfo/Idh/MocA family oxidoreductase [Acidobacteriota bacterium]
MPTNSKLRTVLVGAGKIGAGYADDTVMARHFRFASHAQVLSCHPEFSWEAMVEPIDTVRATVQQRWKVPLAVRSLEELRGTECYDVAVLATPPKGRADVLNRLPSVRAVLVEKPLGISSEDVQKLYRVCKERNIIAQVNFTRRSDEVFRNWARGDLSKLIGTVQNAVIHYGNGLQNNGTHMLDLVRMLVGEVAAVRALGESARPLTASIPGDVDVPFALRLDCDITVVGLPLEFRHYRENGLELWGERGRVSILQEGLGLYFYPRSPNRAMQGEGEIASDEPQPIGATLGRALYHMYTNIAANLRGEEPLCSPIESALKCEEIVDCILQSSHTNGSLVRVSQQCKVMTS